LFSRRLPHWSGPFRRTIARFLVLFDFDLVNAFWHFFKKPRTGEVYNIGGGRYANCSMLEAIALCEEVTGSPLNWSYVDDNRIGDHMWWISDIRRFQAHYPDWTITYDISRTLAGNLRRGAWPSDERNKVILDATSTEAWLAAGSEFARAAKTSNRNGVITEIWYFIRHNKKWDSILDPSAGDGCHFDFRRNWCGAVHIHTILRHRSSLSTVYQYSINQGPFPRSLE